MSTPASPVVMNTAAVVEIHDANTNTVEASVENPVAPKLESVTGGSEAGDFVKVVSPVQSEAVTPNVIASVATVGPDSEPVQEVEPPTIPANEQGPEVNRSATVEDVEDEADTQTLKFEAVASTPIITGQDTKKAVEVGNSPVPSCRGQRSQEQTNKKPTTATRPGNTVSKEPEGPERTYIFADGELIEIPAEILQGPQSGISALVVAVENGRKVLKPIRNASTHIPTLVPMDQLRNAGSSRVPDFQMRFSLNCLEGSDDGDEDANGPIGIYPVQSIGGPVHINPTRRVNVSAPPVPVRPVHDGDFDVVEERDETFDVVLEHDGSFDAIVQPNGANIPPYPQGPGGRVNIAEPRSDKPATRKVRIAPETSATAPYPPPPAGNDSRGPGNNFGIGRPNIGNIGRPFLAPDQPGNGNGPFVGSQLPPMPPMLNGQAPPGNLTYPPPPPAGAQQPENFGQFSYANNPVFGLNGPDLGPPRITPVPKSPVMPNTAPNFTPFNPASPPDMCPKRFPGLWGPNVRDHLSNQVDYTVHDMAEMIKSQQRTITNMAEQLIRQNRDSQIAWRDAHDMLLSFQRQQLRASSQNPATHSYNVQNLHQHNGTGPRTTAATGGYDSDEFGRRDRQRSRRTGRTFEYNPFED